MNQEHLQIIFHVNGRNIFHVNLIVENVIQKKNGIIISVNISVPVSIKNQQNIACAKKIMLGIQAYLLANVTQIVTLVNI